MSEPDDNPLDDTGGASLEFEAQVTDLRPPARSRLVLWSATSLLWPRFSLRQRIWRAGSASAAVLLAFMVLLAASGVLHFPTAHHAISASGSSHFKLLDQRGGVLCLTDAAWSPDSTRVALLGYQGACAGTSYAAGIVNVYDVATGRLISWFEPDGAIMRALVGSSLGALPATPLQTGVRPTSVAQTADGPRPTILFFWHMLWSDNGRYLAITFSAVSPGSNSPRQPAKRQDGLLLVSPDGSNRSVLLQTVDAFAVFSEEWGPGNTVRTLRTPPAVFVPTALLDITQPAALVYRWGAGGSLAPQAMDGSQPPAPGALAPIGNPNGGSAFTLWQPGFVAAARFNGAFTWYTWNTSFAAWSPGERYLVDAISTSAWLVTPSAPEPGMTDQKPPDASVLPSVAVRDAALRQVLDGFSVSSVNSNALVVAVAWRPDGKVLAAYSLDAGGPTGVHVNLYDCATGHLLASLLPDSNRLSTLSATTALRWSPDGSHLLLLSAPLGSATLWGPGELPA